MWRRWLRTWPPAAALAAAGCATGGLYENPVMIQPDAAAAVCENNPVYVPLGAPSYPEVFSKVLDVTSDYFDIAFSNRFDGRIETYPRVAPGLGQPWKPGSPDLYERTLATLQSIRHTARIRIIPAGNDGFFVDVRVFKELEDLAVPTRPNATAAVFQSSPTVERQYDVVGEFVGGAYNWIPAGRDAALEQAILRRIAAMDARPPVPLLPTGTCAPVPPTP